MQTTAPEAVIFGDLHLSALPPSCRRQEPNWFEAMAKQIKELTEIANGAPVLCAGDVFDRWTPPHELLTFAMDVLPPNFWAIPGQHDMAYHRYQDLHKTAFGVLQKAGRIKNIQETELTINGNPVIGVPWGAEIAVCNTGGEAPIVVAHKYVWSNNQNRHENADEQGNWANVKKSLRPGTLAVFGDNHTPFSSIQLDWNEPVIQNTKSGPVGFGMGSFFRRQKPDKDLIPRVLVVDRALRGKLKFHLQDLKTPKTDIFVEEEESVAGAIDTSRIEAFVGSLHSLSATVFDFRQRLLQAADALENDAAANLLRKAAHDAA